MKITRTKKGAKILLTANDVDSAVMQFVCTCYPEFARGYSLNALNAQAVTLEAILAVRKQGAVNDIGVPGQEGFGVGVCPGPLPEGMTASDTYGNYIFTDGSIMVWIPAFFYKIGTDKNLLPLHAVSIKPFDHFKDMAHAKHSGYALHRAFYDGGVVQPGVFVDKFMCSNNGGIASSLMGGKPLSTSCSHNPIKGLNDKPENAFFGAIQAAKTRGVNFFVNSRFIHAALALLSLAHAGASTDTTHCGWFGEKNNFPKGCNNASRGDYFDSEIRYEGDGYGQCGLTGSANHFNRTTHNGQISGVADLNGLMYEINPGLTSDGKQLLVLNTAARMKDMTSGITSPSDHWGPKGRKKNYEPLPDSDEFPIARGYQRFGSDLSVLSGDLDGTGWQLTGAGIALPGKPTNPMMNGGYWNYPEKDMVPVSSCNWSSYTGAGVWGVNLSVYRTNAYSTVGFRSACYLD